jgi:hypothetical protein
MATGDSASAYHPNVTNRTLSGLSGFTPVILEIIVNEVNPSNYLVPNSKE